jgi:hypothetical protein
MKKAFTYILCVLLVVVGSLASICLSPGARAGTVNASQHDLDKSVDTFLNKYDLKVQGQPSRFNVKVPETWQVPLGAYPVGLYWGLANEFSKDAGLDLTTLKGRTVEVLVYSLVDGLPGEGEQARFKYPSNVVLLVKEQKVVGAWLAFNITGVGPSVKKHNLQDITGLNFEKRVEQEKYFDDPGKNADLATLGPTEVLNAFFEAINKGDRTRANACLSPQELLNSLTMNLKPDCLYNPDFNQNNSLVENIVKAKPLSYSKVIGNQTTAEVAVDLNIQWKDSAFNTPGRIQTRFAVLEKEANGWKLDGLGTGP